MRISLLICLLLGFSTTIHAQGRHSGECNHPGHYFPAGGASARLDYVPEEGSLFREVTKEAGISYEGVSYGHAWADINKDGYPDLFCTGHGRPQLYINLKNGTFSKTDVEYYRKADTINGEIFYYRFYDMHGAAFSDVNNDGFPDLLVQLGGDMGRTDGKENLLFLNDNGKLVFENKAAAFGLKDSLGRGRSALWFDQDQDGYLDLFLSNVDRNDGQFSSALYRYNPGSETFSRNQDLGLTNTSIYFGGLIQSSDRHRPNLVTVSDRNDFLEVYDYSKLPLKMLQAQKLFGIRDATIGDFNGDAQQDIFLTANRYASEAILANDTTLMIYLYAKQRALGYSDEYKVSFKSDGNLKIDSRIYPYKDKTRTYWRIGSGAYQPSNDIFSLDPKESRNHNFPNTCILCLGTNIGLNTSTGKWEVYQSDPIDQIQTAIKITSSRPITDIQTYNFRNEELFSPDKMMISIGNGQFREVSDFLKDSPNLTTGVSVVTGDFDNDMDLDIIVSCQGSAVNYPNRYYENDGNGQFRLVEDFGAAAAQGGRSGSISTVDFNNDGFLDLFVENGEGQLSDEALPLHFNDGPYRLYQNKRNTNHWVKLDISDQDSPGNKSATGTTIFCYAGGKKQVRLKGTEYHAYTQNDPVVHFGLGPHQVIDSIEAFWPDGGKSTYYSLNADSIYIIPDQHTKVGNEKIIRECNVTLFPNPATDHIVMNNIPNTIPMLHYSVFSSDGKKVEEAFPNIPSDYIYLDKLNSYSPGIYILNVLLEDGRRCIGKFNVLNK